MTTPLGPKGPFDPNLGRVLPFSRRPSVESAGVGAASPATETKPVEATTKAASPETSTFDRAAGSSSVIAAPVEGAGKSQVLARLQAMGIEGRKRVKTAEPMRVVDGADGRVHDGSLSIESRAGLAKLEGVTRLAGSLSLQEGAVKNADLLALRDLKVVEGRLTFEGMKNA